MTYKTLFLYGVILCFVGCSSCMLRVASFAPVDAAPLHEDAIVLSDSAYLALCVRDSLNEVGLNDYNKMDSISHSNDY